MVEVEPGPEPGPVVDADPSVELAVVHEDDDVLVVDKPAGLVVHPGAGNVTGTLVHGLVARYPEIADGGGGRPPRHRPPPRPGHLGPAGRRPHRGRPAAAWWRPWPRAHVERSYLALVHGCARGRRRAGRRPRRALGPPAHPKMAGQRAGQGGPHRLRGAPAVARPRLLAAALPLETGRTHQIRVHLAAIGHPVVGDDAYDRGHRRPVEVPRLFLHATRLAFDHPITGEPLAFESPLPADLARSWTPSPT